MNTHQLKKRYQKSHDEIVEMIQLHLGELTDHARYEKGVWYLDKKAVEIMDSVMGYKTYIPKENFGEEEKAQELEAAKEVSNEVAETETAEVSAVDKEPENVPEEPLPDDELTLLKKKLANTEQELANLQEKFTEIQNGREAMNSSFIKKHQLRAETAEKELKKVQKRFQEDMAHKDERIKELEVRIENMQEKLVANHDELEQRQKEINDLTRQIESIKEDAAARCSKAELRVLDSKRSEDKLYQELHVTENKVNTLSQRLETANEDRSEALKQMAEMKAEFVSVKAKLIEITAGLGDYLTAIETISDVGIIKEETIELPAPKGNEPPEAQPIIEKTVDNKLHDQRQELLDQLRHEQAERESPGFLRQFFSKAASLF